MRAQNLNDFKKGLKFLNKTGTKIISREGVFVEYKQSFNWADKDKYAKSAASFANRQGGFIIFGIQDLPKELVGLQTANFENTDEAKITEYFNSLFSPEIDFEKVQYSVRGKIVGVMFFGVSRKKPVVAIKNDGDIKEGEIYYRYNARNDKIKFPELRAILEQIKEMERQQWMELFERISKIGPENSAIMNVSEGKINGRGGTVVIDHRLIPKLKFIKEGGFKEKGTPVLKLIGDVKPVSFINRKTLGGGVRITSDSGAPAMRLEEENLLKEFSLDYAKLTSRLRARYSDFKLGKKYQKIKQDLMKKGFSITRKLNPSNPKSAQQSFYTPRIIKEFDKFYTKK